MAIEKRFIHFKKFSDFNSKKLSANEANTQYTVGISGAIQNGSPDVLYQSYVWIKDTQQQWTHGQIYNGSDLNIDTSQYISWDDVDAELSETSTNPVQNQAVTNTLSEFITGIEGLFDQKQPIISDIEAIREGAAKGATAVQPGDIQDEVYITDFDIMSLGPLAQNSIPSLEVDKQGLMDALERHKVILVPYEIADNTSVKGYCTLVGYYEDLLYFKVITEYSELIVETSLDTQYIHSGEVTKRNWYDKQDTLVSGNNIKTINGESIVGSGDITIESSSGTITEVKANGTSIATSGVANIPAATTSKYGVTKLSSATNSTSTSLAATASAVKSAYDLANGRQEKLVSGTNIKTINNTSILGSGNIAIDANIQAVDTSETLDEVNTNTYVKYVAQTLTEEQKAQVRENIGVSDSGGSTSKPIIVVNTDEYTMNFSGTKHMTPNVIYVVTNPLEGMILTDAGFGDDLWYGIQYNSGDVYAEYSVVFTAREDCIFTFPDYILWSNGTVPEIEAGVAYELSISLTLIGDNAIGRAVLVPFKSV